MLEIDVRFKSAADAEWTRLELSPAEFFWHDPDTPDGPWDFDSVANHLHIARLVPGTPITFGKQRVTDLVSGDYQDCSYHYWGGPEDYACIVTHSCAGQVSRELIFTGSMPYKENGCHLVRVALDADTPLTTMNCYMWGRGGDEFTDNMLGAPAA
jgi:hypothetical protein